MQQFEIEFDPTAGQEFEIDLENVIQEVAPPLINLEVDPSLDDQVFKHEGEYGYDEVKVNKVTSEIDQNIKAENIKEGVEILGIKGTLQDGYKVEIEDTTLIFNKGGLVEEGELII